MFCSKLYSLSVPLHATQTCSHLTADALSVQGLDIAGAKPGSKQPQASADDVAKAYEALLAHGFKDAQIQQAMQVPICTLASNDTAITTFSDLVARVPCTPSNSQFIQGLKCHLLDNVRASTVSNTCAGSSWG